MRKAQAQPSTYITDSHTFMIYRGSNGMALLLGKSHVQAGGRQAGED